MRPFTLQASAHQANNNLHRRPLANDELPRPCPRFSSSEILTDPGIVPRDVGVKVMLRMQRPNGAMLPEQPLTA